MATSRPYSSLARNEGGPTVPESYSDLAREIRNLKEEIRQMKELIDLLVTLVVESDDADEDDMSEILLTGGADVPRFNN